MLLAAGVIALSGSCGDEDGNGDGNGTGNGGADAGNGGADVGANDGGSSGGDAGSGDAGNPGPCDPVDGTGCPGAEQRCVLIVNQTSATPQCGSTDLGLVGFEEECTGQNCEAGLTCIQFTGDPTPTCRQVCTAGGGAECSGLSGASSSYTCNEFGDEYGVCIGFEGCSPVDAASCPNDQTCSIVDGETGETGCTPAGPGVAGSSCASAACANGFICLNLGDGAQCWEPCDDSNACSDGEQICAGLRDLDFGVCDDAPEACNPAVPTSCPEGQTCSVIDADANTGCTTAGDANVGEPCGGGTACVRGAICLNIDGGGAQCWQGCDDANPCGGGQTCQPLQDVDWGVCD